MPRALCWLDYGVSGQADNRLEQDQKCDPRRSERLSVEADEAESDDSSDHHGGIRKDAGGSMKKKKDRLKTLDTLTRILSRFGIRIVIYAALAVLFYVGITKHTPLAIRCLPPIRSPYRREPISL